MNRRSVLSASVLLPLAGCNNRSSVDNTTDITKESRPKSKLYELENKLKDLYISYYKIPNIDERYQYCIQEVGLLNIMKNYYGNSLLNSKLDPSTIPINTFKIKYVSSDLGKILATTTRNGRNAYNVEVSDLTSYFFRKTASGYKIDWLFNLYEGIENKEYFCNLGRLFNKGDSTSVTIDDLENVSERYRDKSILIKNTTINRFNDVYVDNLPGVTLSSNGLVSSIDVKAKEKWIGLSIQQPQQNHKYYSKCFTVKDNYDKFKLFIDKPQIRLNLKCQLIQLERSGGGYGVILMDYDVFQYDFFANGEAISAERFE